MSEYIPTIGLEIHAELKTATKIFCRSKNDPDETRPNVNVCPVCMAHPGTLPVINGKAIRHVLRVGVALGAQLADYTEFDRKNYFYPDLPKGYQISQYAYPLVSCGELNGISITRVHLEEDTASSIHIEGEGTAIDYNRAGIPLMELVTEPVITSAKQAGDFARELQLLLRTLGASEANMEKGEMRVEANVSVAERNKKQETRNKLGTKVEIKNLNSFRAMERAIEYEIKRQTQLLEHGEQVVQETRGWDEAKQATFPQRIKEGSADYRYFPDPDLPSLKLSEIDELAPSALQASLPELPWIRRQRYVSLGVRAQDADSFVRDSALGAFFEEVIAGWGGDKKKVVLAGNYIANDLVNMRRDTANRDTGSQSEISISVGNFKKIIEMLSENKLSSRGAKELLSIASENPTDPEEMAKKMDILQVSAVSDLEAIVRDVLCRHASVVADYKAGKEAALQYLLGQAMKASKGAGNPSVLRDLILKGIKG